MHSAADQPAPAPPPAETGGDGASRPRRWITLLKLAATLTIFAVIASCVDLGEMLEKMREFPLRLIGLVLLLWIAQFFLSVCKWDQLLKVHGLQYSYAALSRWYAIGYFYNQLLPSIIGGDGYRIFKTMRNGRHRACAVLPVFLERLSGIAALWTLGTVSAVVDWSLSGNVFSYWAMIVGGGCLGVGLLGLAVWCGTQWHQRVLAWRRTPNVLRVLAEHSAEYLQHPVRCFWAGLISFVFHGGRGLIYWILLWGLDVPIGILPVLVVLAATTVISMLPISLGGYGLIEGSFMACMLYYGVDPEAALTAMLVMRATTLPIAAVGGLLGLWEHRRSDDQVRPMSPVAKYA